jgi:hypothetical protein
MLAKQAFYCLIIFGGGVLQTISLGWPQTKILPISASQVARILPSHHSYLNMISQKRPTGMEDNKETYVNCLSNFFLYLSVLMISTSVILQYCSPTSLINFFFA